MKNIGISRYRQKKMPKCPKNKHDRLYITDYGMTFPWLSYSVSEDGAYCALCIAFQDQYDAQQNQEFVCESTIPRLKECHW
jgi:hypothetical protein